MQRTSFSVGATRWGHRIFSTGAVPQLPHHHEPRNVALPHGRQTFTIYCTFAYKISPNSGPKGSEFNGVSGWGSPLRSGAGGTDELGRGRDITACFIAHLMNLLQFRIFCTLCSRCNIVLHSPQLPKTGTRRAKKLWLWCDVEPEAGLYFHGVVGWLHIADEAVKTNV